MLNGQTLSVVHTNRQSLYQQWQQAILSGNSLFERQQIFAALFYYQKAIGMAEELVSIQGDFRMALVSLIVSHHNLADVYLANEEAELAGKQLSKVHDQVVCLQRKYQHDLERQEVIFWGLRRTYSALLMHRKQQGPSGLYALPGNPCLSVIAQH